MFTDFQAHEFTPYCWCKPTTREAEHGATIVLHRPQMLTMDFHPRARARLLEGVPA